MGVFGCFFLRRGLRFIRSYFITTCCEWRFLESELPTRILAIKMKGYIFLFLMVIACLSAVLIFVSWTDASSGWSRTYQGGIYDSWLPFSVIQTSDGGYALAGQTTTYTSLSSTYDSRLVKTDSHGNQQWAKQYSGPNTAGAEYRVIQTSDGIYALATSEMSDFDLHSYSVN